MIENYFVMLVIHLKSLVGNIVSMTHAIFKIETNVKKIYFFFQRQCTVACNKFWSSMSFQNLVRLSQI
jgi:hypothetical protein